MTLEDIYHHFGSFNQVAKLLGISRSSLSNWQKRGYVPLAQQRRLEELTNGALTANEEHANPSETQNEYWPNYRYYDKDHGMCSVDSLVFQEGLKAKITYTAKELRDGTISTFDTKHLMQMVNYKDITGKFVYEGDVLQRQNNTIFVFTDITLLSQLIKIAKFKIIGNIYDGKNYGIEPTNDAPNS